MRFRYSIQAHPKTSMTAFQESPSFWTDQLFMEFDVCFYRSRMEFEVNPKLT